MASAGPAFRAESGRTFDPGVPLLDFAEPLDDASFDTPDHATAGLPTGRYRVKMLPTPGSLSTVISPARRRVSSRQMDRPKPVPPYLRLVGSSPSAEALQ